MDINIFIIAKEKWKLQYVCFRAKIKEQKKKKPFTTFLSTDFSTPDIFNQECICFNDLLIALATSAFTSNYKEMAKD